MASSSTALLQQKQLYWKIPLCKFHSTPLSHSKSSHLFPFPESKRTLHPIFCFPPLLFIPMDKNNSNHTTEEHNSSRFPRKRTKFETLLDLSSKNNLGSDRGQKERANSKLEIQIPSGFSSMKSEEHILLERLTKTIQRNTQRHVGKTDSAFSAETKQGVVLFNGKPKRTSEKCDWNRLGEEKIEKGAKRRKQVDSPAALFRVSLEMCSKKGDVLGALKLYDSAKREDLLMSQYEYNVLLYLCSSAATGIIHPAKSGSGNGVDGSEIRVSEDFKNLALKRGFEIYDKMCLEDVEMNESSLISVARMALAMGNGHMAFETVKKMKALGISPRLRSYGPAISAFCKNGDIHKAFSVEKHMLENNVHPEEPELEALLRLSVEMGRADKVYYLLHKLRTSVRKVSPSVANLVEKWFNSKGASRVGKRTWDKKLVMTAIADRGGGWHGEGWLGTGKWSVLRTSVGEDGFCSCCDEKLAIIDLDPVQTENFAESVAAIATKREKNASFQKFQVE